MRERGNRAKHAIVVVSLLALVLGSSTATAAELRESGPPATMAQQGPVLLFLLTVLLSTPRTNSMDATGMLMATDRANTLQVGCAVPSGC
jgi:hypothetical protein